MIALSLLPDIRALDLVLRALAAEESAIDAESDETEVLTCFGCHTRTAVPFALLPEWEERHSHCRRGP